MEGKLVVRSRDEALKAITDQLAGVIDLEYADGGKDFLELGSIGRRQGVSVMYRVQEMVVVETLRAMRRGLALPKETFRQRHLYCLFDLFDLPTDTRQEIMDRANELGDMIFPGEMLRDPYLAWKD